MRELSREPILVRPGQAVFVCENPSVVAAAADRHGARTRPLVCLDGVPSTAALVLLRSLSQAGAQLRIHVDFDWGGVRIAHVLLERVPAAQPWQMAVDDYQQAANERRGVLELNGAPVEARWDAGLGAALRLGGVAVFEEQVLLDLLNDLGG